MRRYVKVFDPYDQYDIDDDEDDDDSGAHLRSLKTLDGLEKTINEWADTNPVKIINASLAPLSEDKGETDRWVAIVVYEKVSDR